MANKKRSMTVIVTSGMTGQGKTYTDIYATERVSENTLALFRNVPRDGQDVKILVAYVPLTVSLVDVEYVET